MMIVRSLCTLAMPVLLSSCAYVTAVPAGSPHASGIPVYGVKSFVVVNSEGVSSVIVPDCSQKYLLRAGSVFAKNHTVVAMNNGVVTSLDTDQDSSASLATILDFAKTVIAPSTPAGAGLSKKAGGGVADEMAIYSVSCDGGTTRIEKAMQPGDLVKVKSAMPQAALPPPAADIPGRPAAVATPAPAATPTPAPSGVPVPR